MSEERQSRDSGPAPSPILWYYEGKLPAARCVSEMKRHGPDWAAGADLQSLLVRLSELDPDLTKTWALVKGQPARAEPVSGLRRWLHLVVQAQSPASEELSNPHHLVEDLLSACAPLKSKTTKRAMHLLKLTILDLRWQRDLSAHHVVGAFVNHFAGARESTEALERHALASLLKLGSTAQLRSLSRTLAWTIRQSAVQAEELVSVRRELGNAKDQNSRLVARTADLNNHVTDLTARLEEANERVRTLEGQLAHARDSAVLRLHDLLGQVSGKLNGRVDPLLRQATDALRMSSPQIRAASEFVETAQESVGELIRWLAAESTSERPTA